MRLGVIQGRLSPPIEGFQECPKNWKREFVIAKEIGLTHIEWVITKNRFEENPLLREDLTQYPISSICADFIIDQEFFSSSVILKRLNRVCKAAEKSGVNHVTLPLLEGSDVSEKQARKQAIALIRELVKTFPTIEFLIEAELGFDSTADVLTDIPEVGIVYDTGNMTTVGVDHEQYIQSYGSRIRHIHLKDRMVNSQGDPITVFPGLGNTPFRLIFQQLAATHASRGEQKLIFSLQTARGDSGKEKSRIRSDKEFFERIYHEEYL